MAPILKLVKRLSESIVAEKEVRDLARNDGRRVLSLATSALGDQSGSLNNAAQAALDEGRKLQKSGELAEARAQLTWAWLIASATGNGGISGEAMDALESVHRDQVQAATKRVPALAKRLDLIVRDEAVDATLDAVAKAAGIRVRLVRGSLDDAKSLSGDREVWTSYLDLSGATAAEALDWLLSPECLDWWLDGDTIVVGTARRRSGQSAWVYDVRSMALPGNEELIGDDTARLGTFKKAADDFLGAIRQQVGVEAPLAAWFAPGHVMLFGDSALHARAGRLFAALADSKAKVPEELSALHKRCAKRAATSAAENEKRLVAQRRHKTALTHAEYGWQLLAAAMAGQLDLEALSELEFAWKQPENAELLQGPSKALVLRSLWTLTEAGRVLPDEAELKMLIDNARKLCQPATEDAVATLKKSPNDAGAFAAILFAALAERDDAAAARSLLDLLSPPADKSPDVPGLPGLAKALGASPDLPFIAHGPGWWASISRGVSDLEFRAIRVRSLE